MVIALSGNELAADAGTKKALLSYIMAFPVALKVCTIFRSLIFVINQPIIS